MNVSLDLAAADTLVWLRDLAQQGQDLRVHAHKKLLTEAVEYAVEGDLIEAADVFMCLLGALDHQGYTYADLADAVYHKLKINKKRVWKQQEDGTFQHLQKLETQ